jgi:hypothetical protein
VSEGCKTTASEFEQGIGKKKSDVICFIFLANLLADTGHAVQSFWLRRKCYYWATAELPRQHNHRSNIICTARYR